MTVKLICGDALAVLPTLEAGSVDCVVTDPPYLNLSGGLIMASDGGVAPCTKTTTTVGDVWSASLAWASEAWRVVRYAVLVMCGYNSVAEVRMAFPEATAKGLAVWHHANAVPSYRNVPRFDTEFIWLLEKQPGIEWSALKSLVIDIPSLPAGCFASERVLESGSKRALHPCQKPIELMKRLLLPGCESVLDPFAGLGTTLIACFEMGRNGIGIEIDPGYFAIAEKRIAEAQMQPLLEMR